MINLVEILKKAASLAIVITILLVIYQALKMIIIKIKLKGVNERKRKTFTSMINNILKYIMFLIVILIILDAFKVDTKTILASIGVLGIIIGLAIQDLIKALVAGLFIVLDDQYNVGDIVTINNFKGEVISFGLKTTKIRSNVGDIKSISNNVITEIINHSLSDYLAIVDIQLSYDNDLEEVEKIMKKACVNMQKNITNIKNDIMLFGYNNYLDYGVQFRIVAQTEPLLNDEVSRIMRKEINKIIKTKNIKLAYPQVVIYDGKRI